MKCSDCRAEVHPVVGVDIDGVLADYHGHFHRFAERYVDRPLVRYRWGDEHPKYPYNEEFSEWLGLEKGLYRDIKLAYRQGGQKRIVPLFPGGASFVKDLRKDDIEVVLCTTRPYLRLDNIDPDTREWLRRHDIGYDGLIYGDDKYERLIEIAGKERIIGIIDDLPDQFDRASSLGLNVILKRNGHTGSAKRFPCMSELLSVKRSFLYLAQDWRQRNG